MSTAPNPSDLVELYVDQGLSLVVIGRRFGHTADWVRARLVVAGVPIRPAGRQPTITDDQVRSLLNQGRRVAEIAQELGVTDSSVLDRMRANGWTGPPRRPRGPSRNAPPPPNVESLRQLYITEGLSVAEVAQRLRLSRGRVTAALDAAGIPRRRPGWANGNPPDPISRGMLIKLYLNDGSTVREVAAALGTTTTRVNAALRRHGIPRRPEPKAPPPLKLDRTRLTELYVTRRLDDTEIGVRFGVPAWRVTMRRRELDVHRPPAPPPHPEPPVMPPAEDLHRWYVTDRRTLEQIARQHHTTRDTVRTWLQTAGVSVQPRTSREQRKHLDPKLLRDWYLVREWSAAQVAAELDTTVHLVLRTLHEHGIPVRKGGPHPSAPAHPPKPGSPPFTTTRTSPLCCTSTASRHGQWPGPSPNGSRHPPRSPAHSSPRPTSRSA